MLSAWRLGQGFLNLVEVPEDLVLLLARKYLVRLVAKNSGAVGLTGYAPLVQEQVYIRRRIAFRVPLQVVFLPKRNKELQAAESARHVGQVVLLTIIEKRTFSILTPPLLSAPICLHSRGPNNNKLLDAAESGDCSAGSGCCSGRPTLLVGVDYLHLFAEIGCDR